MQCAHSNNHEYRGAAIMDILKDPASTFALVTIFAYTGSFLTLAVINEQSETWQVRVLYFLLALGLFILAIVMTGLGANILTLGSLILIFAFTGFYLIRAMVIKKNESWWIRSGYLVAGIVCFTIALGLKGMPSN